MAVWQDVDDVDADEGVDKDLWGLFLLPDSPAGIIAPCNVHFLTHAFAGAAHTHRQARNTIQYQPFPFPLCNGAIC